MMMSFSCNVRQVLIVATIAAAPALICSRRPGNTATIGTLIAQGMKAVTTLDAIMHNKYASQPAKMAAWLTAAHIERDAQRGTTPTPPTATPHP